MFTLRFAFVGLMFCSLLYASFLDLREYDGCMLPVSLAYSADEFTGNAWWHWGLELQGSTGRSKVPGVGLCILSGWPQ